MTRGSSTPKKKRPGATGERIRIAACMCAALLRAACFANRRDAFPFVIIVRTARTSSQERTHPFRTFFCRWASTTKTIARTNTDDCASALADKTRGLLSEPFARKVLVEIVQLDTPALAHLLHAVAMAKRHRAVFKRVVIDGQTPRRAVLV